MKISTLEKRDKHMGIYYVYSHIKGQDIPENRLEDCSQAMLKQQGQNILVTQLRSCTDGLFRAVIYGFEPSFALSYAGLSIGDTVEFSEAHVFSAAQ